MKKKLQIYALTLVCISFLSQNIFADQYFATYYGFTTWEEEQVYLLQLGIYLQKNPELVGYIAFFVGEKDKLKDVEARMKRAKSFFNKMKIAENRIIIVNAGKDKTTKIILQPMDKKCPPPKVWE
jgi:hypothetical protein